MEWRNRIVGLTLEDPAQLLANPRNYRVHPGLQRDAMRAALARVGWLQGVVVNRRTGHVVDGHLRVEEAISAGATEVPVLTVDIDEEEEAFALVSLDPLSAMAEVNTARLQELLAEVTIPAGALVDMLQPLAPDWYRDHPEPDQEPSPEASRVRALYDDSLAVRMRDAIRDADLEPALRTFLDMAAYRLVVYDLEAIASYAETAAPEVRAVLVACLLVGPEGGS